MGQVKVLHLSDFHFNMEKWPDAELIIKALIADIHRQFPADQPGPDLCIFSGDLFQAGGLSMPKTDFHQRVMQPILEAARLDADRVFMCCGNHDIDRQSVRDNPVIQTGLLSTLKSRYELNTFYDQHQSNDDSSYFDRLKGFEAYEAPFGLANEVRRNRFYRSFLIKVGSTKVGLAAFNTSWLSTGEEGDIDRGKLLLPERSLLAAIDDLQSADVRIAIHHHPLDYLADYCRFDAKALLFKHFNLICYGHMHQPMPLLTRSVVGEAVSSEAGALYTWRGRYNGFCFITLDLNRREAVFVHRRWEDSPAYKFVSANELSETGETSFPWSDATQAAATRGLIDVNKAYRPFLEEAANEHMLSSHTNTNAPRSFDDLFVDVPLTQRSFDNEVHASTSYVTFEELLAFTKPVVVFGNREAGKTTLSFGLALYVSGSIATPVRSPVMIDLEKFTAGSGLIERETKKVLAYAGLQNSLSEKLKSGSFVYLFDNYDAQDGRKSKMIRDFIALYPANKYVLFADEKGGLFQKSALEALGKETCALSLHPLKRREVKELTRRWLEPSGLYTDTTFHAVLKKIQDSGLPTTAYVVSMIAWTLERQNLKANINEAALLERFVDAILNKADINGVSRSAYDYTIQESFLAELAYVMRRNGDFTVPLSILDDLAIKFVSARGWVRNAANFVRELIDTGILVNVEEVVGFRYRCLREYFLAKYINEDDEYREFVYSEDNYLDYARELDILTGLRRKDGRLLRLLIDYTQTRVDSGLEAVDLKKLDDVKFRFGGSTLMPRPDSLGDLGLDDDTVEDMLDTADREARPAKVKGDLEEGRQPPSQQRVYDISTAYASMMLLSKVVRNTELLTDVALKQTAVAAAMTHWARFLGFIVTSFDIVIGNDENESHSEILSKLNDDQKQFLEYFLKVVLPVAFSGEIHNSIGTEKLRQFFEAVVDDEKTPLFVRLLTAFLLIDVSFIDRSDDAGEMTKKVEGFAKKANSRFISELISEKLLMVYYKSNIGDGNRRVIERFYAETRLRASGIKAASPSYGSRKSGIVQVLRKNLSENKIDEE